MIPAAALFLIQLPQLTYSQTAPPQTPAPQNPSPMTERTRSHSRIVKSLPEGRREKLDLGTLFLPAKLKGDTILFFFHGGDWLPEAAAARKSRIAVVTIHIGAGSGVYQRAFADPGRFPRLLGEAEAKAGRKFSKVALGGWSAGCAAIREIFRSPEARARVEVVLAMDGIHAQYIENRKPDPANLTTWLSWAREAVAGRKRMILTHSEVFPGTYASTTETADWLLDQLKLRRNPVLKWGPVGMQQLSEVKAGRFTLLGFAGNSAPDHVDHLHGLPEFLDLL